MRWFVLPAAAVIILSFLLAPRSKNNVCKTFWDYYSNRDSNENCYYNPDHELQVPEIITRHGYPVETYKATTKDGYILTLFRIPYGKSLKSGNRKPVFIQHGITINSGAFVNTGNKSFAFSLADAGYDVWLGNFRGSLYSRNHSSLHENSAEFWNFSFHEHGIYDLPAQLDVVCNITKQKVIYIGFSMGSSASYVYGVTNATEARKKVQAFISLAPVAFMGNLPLYTFASYIWNFIKIPVQAVTNGKFAPRPPLPVPIFRMLCLPFPIQMEFCQIPDMLAFGINYEQNDPETLPVTLQHNSDFTSVKTLTHYAQLMLSGQFHYFDYGEEVNKKMYGSRKPPIYDLSQMTIPNYLIVAPNDLLSTERNVNQLLKAFPDTARPEAIYVIKNKRFNHVDFFTGKNSISLVHEPVINIIDKLVT